MRILVFFDLPTLTKEEQKVAQKFRNDLVKDGYYMIQKSIYGRLCGTFENVTVHEARLQTFMPAKGHVRSLVITEKQYSEMRIFGPNKTKKDRRVSENQLSFF